MRVEHLMSRDVVTVSPETSLRDAAALLAEHHISGMPVCAVDGTVVGVVSDGDVVRAEQGIPPETSMLAWMFDGSDLRRAHARTVAEAMSTPAITTTPGADVSAAARLLTERRIKRLPVLLGGELVGILTRSDLVRAFCRPDAELRRELSEDVLLETLWISPSRVAVEVRDGVVHLTGRLETHSEADLAVAFARRVPGVVDVLSDLTWRTDDLARRRGRERMPHRVR